MIDYPCCWFNQASKSAILEKSSNASPRFSNCSIDKPLIRSINDSLISPTRRLRRRIIKCCSPSCLPSFLSSLLFGLFPHISIPDIPNSAIIARVRHQLAISTGAACSSGIVTPSHVLQAMNLGENIIEGALRIGIGKFTTKEEIEKASFAIASAVNAILSLK